MIRNGKAIDHSNVGGVWGSLIAFIVAFGAFLGCEVFALGYAITMWLTVMVAARFVLRGAKTAA